MVHALEEIHRVLAPGGILIDLRPLADRWPVEVVSGSQFRELGRLVDLPSGLADDEAANNAVELAREWGWFIRQEEIYFPLFCYWDSPAEMFEHITVKWEDYVQLETGVRESVESAWAAAGADRRVRVKLKMLLTRWEGR